MARILLQIGYPEETASQFTSTGFEPERLGNLASLNVFIGPNNSGKSRCLRSLFAAQKTSLIPNRGLWAELYEAMQHLRDQSPNRFESDDVNDLLRKFISMPLYHGRQSDYIRLLRDIFGSNEHTQIRSCAQEIEKILGEGATVSREIINTITSTNRKLHHTLNINPEDPQVKFESCKDSMHYIPSLRSLRRVGNYADQTNDFLAKATKDDYFHGNDHIQRQLAKNSTNQAIFYTGERYYSLVRSYLLGTLEQREAIRSFEAFIGEQFFQGQPITLIPREENEQPSHLVLRIGSEDERPLHDQGDGLQQIIIMTLPMFLHANTPSLFFIEEPELYLHPGMQRKFIETVLKGKGHENRQTFITTHSTQFLDMTLDHEDISVFRFQKSVCEKGAPTFNVTNTSNKDRQLLLELGVHNSSVLLANCTLWVEGITDRLYLRRYFELYQDHRSKNEDDFIFWREDTHYSFVEYSGSNLTHWSAGSDGDEAIKMKFLCGDALVICDKDDSSAKNIAHQALIDRIGEHAYVLDVREIENLISADVLSRVVCEYENDQSLKLKHFTQSAYKTKSIGTFIQEKVLPDDYTSVRPVKTEQPYAATSGTIKDKLGFCRKALDHTTSYGHVSEYARAVCERMYDFIKSHQPK